MEAMQKNVEFHHNKDYDMLRLGFTLPDLAGNCTVLPSSISAKFYLFKEGDKDLLSIVCEIMVGGPSLVFGHKTVVDKTHICESRNLYKSIFEMDVSQVYFYSMCKHIPPVFYRRFEFVGDLQ